MFTNGDSLDTTYHWNEPRKYTFGEKFSLIFMN